MPGYSSVIAAYELGACTTKTIILSELVSLLCPREQKKCISIDRLMQEIEKPTGREYERGRNEN